MATLLAIRDRIKRRTDNQYTDGFVEDSEIDDLINLHYKELYELLEINGLHRAELGFVFTADGSGLYGLPGNLYSIISVHRANADGTFTYLKRHDKRLIPSDNANAPATTYRVVGFSIELNPLPIDGDYVITYVPIPGDLTDDADELDGVLGWEEFVVAAVCLDIAVKESVDMGLINVLERQLERQRMRIKTAARNVELSEAPRIADVRGYDVDVPELRFRNIAPVGWPWR